MEAKNKKNRQSILHEGRWSRRGGVIGALSFSVSYGFVS